MHRRMVLAGMMLLAEAGLQARPPGSPRVVNVNVWVDLESGVTISGTVLSMAQSRATDLLADGGVHLEWHAGKAPESGELSPTIRIVFLRATPASFRDPPFANALAAARPFDSAHHIMVFYDRVTLYLSSMGMSASWNVLGHILAHEIVHSLEGVNRHSSSGLMTASWGWREMKQITGGGLYLAHEDRDLLHIFLQPRKPRPPDGKLRTGILFVPQAGR